MNLENSTLTNIRQSQKDKYYDSTYMRQTNSQKQEIEWQLPGAEEETKMWNCSMGREFQFCKMKKLWKPVP